MDEFGDSRDLKDDIGEGYGATLHAASLEIALERSKLIFKPENYLALGAGQAAGEIEYAYALGIPLRNITIVDKVSTKETKQAFELLRQSGVEAIRSDLFDFLKRSREAYSLVSGFGIEYILDREWPKLLRLLPNVTAPGSIVHLSPGFLDAKEHVDTWRRYGFNQLPTVGNVLIYQRI